MGRRISSFSKEWKDGKGEQLANSFVIELLKKHGVDGKTASSNISDEEAASIMQDLKNAGYTSGETAASAGKQKDGAKEQTKGDQDRKDAPVKKDAPAPKTEDNQVKKDVQKSAASKDAQPKKKKIIIIAGNNPGGQGRPAAGPSRGQSGNFSRGPIKPRENMIDRAGAAARREETEREQAEAVKAAEEKAANAAKAEEASVQAETKPAESEAVRETREIRNDRPERTDRPERSERPLSGDRPVRNFDQRNDGGFRSQGQRRPADGNGRPFGGNQGGRPQNGQGGGRPFGGGQGGRPGAGRPFGGNQGGRPFGGNQGGGRPFGGGQGGRPGAGRPEAAPIPQETRRGKHSEKDRDRENRRDSRYDDEERGRDRNSAAGRFIKPVAKKVEEPEDDIKVIKLPETITIKEFAERMHVQPADIVKKLFLQGEMVTVNQEIDFEKAELIALDYEIMCEKEEKVDVIAELLKEEDEDESKMLQRPPVICVMGHVDHGKTSLLDAIRKTNVIEQEAGGITQKIGAYTVSVEGRKITFLDTPGHEAFTAMRMRGANATDIAVLVVAADDGVMPQTVEAINHAKAAGIELIVAVNKIDKPGANVDRVKQELTEYELVSEDWGGTTVFVPVSAKSGEGIDKLLEMILLTADVLELKANPNRRARGLVIEAELDKGRGPVATILVQKGTLKVGDFVSAGASHGKVRAMIDDKGRRVKEAGPSTPVEILGLSDVPNAGEVFICHPNEKEAKSFAATFITQNKEKKIAETRSKMSLTDLFDKIKEGTLKELNLIIKADVQGSVEAVKQSLEKLSNDEVIVKVIHGGVGAINESDVVLASASNAIIIGFDVRPDAVAKQTAEREGVDIRLYDVIYKAIEDVEGAMKGMLEPVFEEKVIGHAEVRQIFKASAIGNIAGAFILDGYIQRGCKVRITREGEQIFEGPLASLKRFKDDVKEVKAGFECGLVFEGFDKMQELDMVEAYIMVEVPRE